MELNRIVYNGVIKNSNTDSYIDHYLVECTIYVNTIKNNKRKARVIADLKSYNQVRKIGLVYDESQDMVKAISYVLNADRMNYMRDNWDKEFTFHMDHYETEERAYEILLEILTTSYSEYMKSKDRRK